MSDNINTPNATRPPAIIPRRPVNYTAQGGAKINGDSSSEGFTKHRKLLIYVGDMVQIIDPKSHLCGKFGLVEEIHPRNPQYNVIVKIGKIRNPLKFFQLKFCTRIDFPSNGLKNNGTKCTMEENEVPNSRVEDYIDRVEETDEDNKGNREGANLATRSRINFNG